MFLKLVITNGDVLSSKKLQDLYISDVSKVLVSMYDGPEQISKFKKMTLQANVPEEMIILRDRWYDKYNDFGVKLTTGQGLCQWVNKKRLENIKTVIIQLINF